FHVLADSGEDAIAFSTDSDYAANVEKAEALAPSVAPEASKALEEVATPGQHSIEAVSQFLKVAPAQLVKTLLVLGEADESGNQGLVALVLRGDHELNTIKPEKLAGVASPLSFASEQQVKDVIGCSVGSIGP